MYPELKEQLKELRKHLIESTNKMAPLKVWQMQGESVISSLNFSTPHSCYPGQIAPYIDTWSFEMYP